MMRVAIISKAFVRGVYQRKLEEIAAHPGIRLSLITPPYWMEGADRISLDRRYARNYDVRVTPLALNGRFHLHFYPALGRLLENLQPDLVHVDEEPYNFATFLAIHQARRVGARAIFFTWQNIQKRLPPPFSIFEGLNYRRVRGAIAGINEAEAVLRAKGFAKPIWVIPQVGFDPEIFHLNGDRSPNEVFTVGFIGRLTPEKGVLDLLNACAELTGSWRLVYVGDGPLREGLRQRAADVGFADRVEMRGPVSSTQVPALLHEFDALVLPSHTTPTWREQFGRVLVEAMLAGVPVVGSSSGEIPHVIGDAGLVFPEGDSAALRERLERLRANPALATVLRERGRARALTHFTLARVASQTYHVYEDVLSQP